MSETETIDAKRQVLEARRDFHGIFMPKAVLFHPDLSLLEKHLLCEIASLDGPDGCYAENDHFIALLDSSQASVSRGISKLRDMGMVEIAGFNGRRRVLRIAAPYRPLLKGELPSAPRPPAAEPCQNDKPAMSKRHASLSKTLTQPKQNDEAPHVVERTMERTMEVETPHVPPCGDAPIAEREVSPPKAAEVGFDAFWSAYPRKVGKAAARKAWDKTAKDRPPLDAVIAAVESAKSSTQWRRDHGQFIPHPATWLNRGGWDDVMDVPVAPGRTYDQLMTDMERETPALSAYLKAKAGKPAASIEPATPALPAPRFMDTFNDVMTRLGGQPW